MSDYRDRMLQEHTELTEKIVKLDAFLWNNPFFYVMANADKQLLIEQLAHMKSYATTLAERIARTR